jgi:hypothetical protein
LPQREPLRGLPRSSFGLSCAKAYWRIGGTDHATGTAAALALAALLASCSKGKSEFDRANERYEFVRTHGATDAELCEEGKRVVSAAANEQRSEYDTLKLNNDIKCMNVGLERQVRGS